MTYGARIDPAGLAVSLIVAIFTILNDGCMVSPGVKEIKFYIEFATLLVGGSSDEPHALGGLSGHYDVLTDDYGK